MDDSLWQDKLELLSLYYPDYQQLSLADLLRSCGGDVEATRVLLEGPKPVKRSGLHQGVLNVKRQKNESVKKFEENKQKTPKTPRNTSVSARFSPGAGVSPTRGKSEVLTLNTPEDVKKHLGRYASLHQNFFPKEKSDALLEDCLRHRDKYKRLEFSLFGNQCVLNHGFAAFSKPGETYPDLIYNGLQARKPVPYLEVFGECVELIEQYVNLKVVPETPKLPFQSSKPWAGTYCAVNFYEKLQNNLDWHSDRLSHIGPHNFIALVSLGSTRMFRLRSTHKKNAPVYQIPLTHNSLLMMKPGCQEEFKHCVNSMGKPLELHPKIGTMRFGLTFRHYDHDFLQHVPKCKCGLSMTLRRSYKSENTKGQYFWLCESMYQNKECGSFFWADFTNKKGNFLSESPDRISKWIADE